MQFITQIKSSNALRRKFLCASGELSKHFQGLNLRNVIGGYSKSKIWYRFALMGIQSGQNLIMHVISACCWSQ